MSIRALVYYLPSALNDHICRWHDKLCHAAVGIRRGLQLYFTDDEIIRSGSSTPNSGRSNSHVLRDKYRERVLSGLHAVHQYQVMMEKIIVEDDSTFRKPEIRAGCFSIHNGLQF